MRIRDLRRKLLWSLLFGVFVGFALALYGDASRLGNRLAHLDWRYLPLILALTLLNYGLRFLKWHYYLGVIGSILPWRQSLEIFLAGLAMVMTPGKAGELLKAYLLKQRNGTPMARSAPLVLAERLSDGLAMFLLAIAGLWSFRGQGVLFWLTVAVALAMLSFVILSRSRRLAAAILRLWARLPLVARFQPQVRAAYESTYELFSLPNLLLAVGLGVISWGGECLALYLTLSALGLEHSFDLFLAATFTLAVSTLIGAISFLPGGLGATDITLTGLLESLLHISTDLAVAATLIIRFATLWFGVAIGLGVLFRMLRRLDPDARALPADFSPTSTRESNA